MLILKRAMTAIKAIFTYENWFTFLKNHFQKFKGAKEVIIKLRNGIKYQIRTNTMDAGIITEIWIHEYYTKPVAFEIGENDTVVDIGAHIGVFTIFAANKAKKGKVYSFEPVKENFELLKNNIGLNNLINVVPFNMAVSNTTKPLTLFFNDENTGGHSFYDKNQGTSKIVVEATTLEELIRKNNIERIDFLKMDCEGGEYKIFFESNDETLAKINKISMEFHNLNDELNLTTLKNFLERKNFKVVKAFYTSNQTSVGMLYAKR